MTEIATKDTQSTSFLELIKDGVVVIPQIQRDYAQGREDAKTNEIRDNFLNDIADTLSSDTTKPLLLDFIYGSTVENVEGNKFIPLDGQQRLTTLFLLHWFFSDEGSLGQLRIIVNSNKYSRFSYETRVSSKDFCNEFVCHSYESLMQKLVSRKAVLQSEIDAVINDNLRCQQLKKQIDSLTLSRVIKDESWFLWNWHKDPTVKAFLVVLDDLYDRFRDFNNNIRSEYRRRLTSGKIGFHKLPLEQFKLTDELYVKMNARGKELSAFDIFKSSLEEQMSINKVTVSLADKWKNNIDSNWIDVFWNKLAKSKLDPNQIYNEQKKLVEKVEEAYLLFIKRLTVYHLLLNDDCIKINVDDDSIKKYIPFKDFSQSNILSKLREYAVRFDVTDLIQLFNKTGFFGEKFFQYVIDTIESLIFIQNEEKHEGSELLNKVKFEKQEFDSLFDKFILEKPDYESWLEFHALLQYFKFNSALSVSKDQQLQNELNECLRIIRNLSTMFNVFIDEFDPFYTTFKTYREWIDEVYSSGGSASIISYFAKHPKTHIPSGRYVKNQFEEEIIKATLFKDVVHGLDWKREIIEAENHQYFLGQISFLLNWSKTEDEYNLLKFRSYKDKILEIFVDNGLNENLSVSSNHLFRNALMSNTANYLHRRGGQDNRCFVENKDKSRDKSWKSYLRNPEKSENIKNLIDKAIISKKSMNEFCVEEIRAAKKVIIDWRRCFLEFPSIYDKCSKNHIDYWDESILEICLLESSERWNGNNIHSELNTYYWRKKFDAHNSWSAKYYNSQKNSPLTAEFIKDNYEVKVQFTENGNPKKYRITLNFDPVNSKFFKNQDNWVLEHEVKNFIEVEKEIENLLK
jgi:hypothetical protein